MQENEHLSEKEQESPEEEAPASGPLRRSSGAPGRRVTTFRVTGTALLYRYGFMGVLTLAGILILYLLAPMGLSSKDYVVLVILGIWALAFLRYWIYLLDMPYRINWLDGNTLEFVSFFRMRTVPAASILSLKVSPVYPSYLKIRTDRKKSISLLNHVTGLNELITWIREENPDLVTRGC